MTSTTTTQAASDHGMVGGPAGPHVRLAAILSGAAVIVAIVVAFATTDKIGLWGLFPILVYAVLVLIEFNVVLSTAISLVIALIISKTGLLAAGTLLAESLGSFIAVVGLIIMLGAGLGRIAADTGAARTLVMMLLRKIGVSSPTRAQIGIMLASTVLVGALGTLAGANAILAPLAIPVAAAVGRSRPSVAVMLHTAGAAGLVTGPFTPPVVTIMGAAHISYGTYVLGVGLPMAIVVWGIGFFMAKVIHERTASDLYEPELSAGHDIDRPATTLERRAALAFVGTLLVMTVLGIVLKAGYSYAIIVMIVTAVVTAFAGGLSPAKALSAFFSGASSLMWLFFLFWMFNPLLVVMEKSGAYAIIVENSKPFLESVGPWGFLMLVLLIGWIGVSGAAVAQVVLIDKLFAPLAAQLGIPPVAWAASLLGGSQIDWFGPLPNADMIGQMGLARSSNLRMQLFNGWTVMAGTLILFSILFIVLV
jgi:H+/gluconate symporter-like permease